MLLELAQWLARDVRLFNVFNYITLRAVLATMTALAISFVFGPAVIRWPRSCAGTPACAGQAARSAAVNGRDSA